MKTLKQLLEAKGGNVYSITPDARVFDALRLMADKSIGALIVMEGGRIAGIISERDIVRRLDKNPVELLASPVRNAMTSKVITVHPGQSVEECMALMTEKRIRHLPVTEGERLIGVLSIGDLVKEVIAEQRQTIEQLESYIHR